MKKLIVFLCMTVIVSTSSFAAEVVYVLKREVAGDIRYDYPNELLEMAFDKTPEFGDVDLASNFLNITRNRQLMELQNGEFLDVVAQPTKLDWEAKLIPIYIPIKKGIMSYRLFFINKDSQDKLSMFNTLEEVKKLRTGAGSQWSTTRAMKDAGFNLVTTAKYASLFPMLKAKRYEVFPRGIDEIWGEYEFNKQNNANLIIENHLALYIPLPAYFFVNPRKKDLAKRIRLGLDRMIDDGSFDDIFNKYYGDTVAKANLESRKVFEIKNINVSDKIPLSTERYWYKIH